jgi:hypothetical protein
MPLWINRPGENLHTGNPCFVNFSAGAIGRRKLPRLNPHTGKLLGK